MEYLVFNNFDEIGITHFFILSCILFGIGMCGVCLNQRNLLVILMSIELMLLSTTLNFIAFSIYWNNISGQVFAIFILTIAAAESAIGLAIFVTFFKNNKSINVEDLNTLKG